MLVPAGEPFRRAWVVHLVFICYEFEYQRDWGLISDPSVLVEVQHGKVVRVTEQGREFQPPATSMAPTVDTLFKWIERKEYGYGGGRWDVDAVYDQRYGVPLYLSAVSLDSLGYPRCYDCSEGFTVKRFTPLHSP